MSRTMVAGSFAVAALMLVVAMSQPARPAFAAFHCMRIHAVVGGINGDNDAQFVELRMNAGGQTVVAGHRLRFFDANGVQKAEFQFPSNVSGGLTGDSILIGTHKFNDLYTPGGNADFTFDLSNTNGADPQTPVQGPGGKVVFGIPGELNCASQQPLDSVAYGSGSVTADYGTKAVALPAPSTLQGLRLSNLNLNVTNNSTEYSLQTVSSTTESILTGNLATDFRFPRNNGRTLLAVVAPAASVGGTVVEPDAPEEQAIPESANDDDEGSLLIPIAAGTAAVIVAATGLGALELRRRGRRV